MYRELIGNLIKDHNWAKLQEPCPECDIENAEKYVGFTFPEALKALLRETNGDHWFLLSAQEMIAHVKTNREIYPEYTERALRETAQALSQRQLLWRAYNRHSSH